MVKQIQSYSSKQESKRNSRISQGQVFMKICEILVPFSSYKYIFKLAKNLCILFSKPS